MTDEIHDADDDDAYCDGDEEYLESVDLSKLDELQEEMDKVTDKEAAKDFYGRLANG